MNRRTSVFDRIQETTTVSENNPSSSMKESFERGTSVSQENTNQVATVETKKKAMNITTLSEDEISKLGDSTGDGISKFTSQLLSVQRNSDNNGMSQKLDSLIAEAKNLAPEDGGSDNWFSGIFNKILNKKEELFKKFDTVEKRIDILIGQLKDERDVQVGRKNDIQNLMQANYEYAMQLDQAVIAGNKELEKLATKKEMLSNPQTNEEALEHQKVSDLHQLLDKKVTDLQALRLLSTQMGPKLNTMKSNALSLINSFDNIINQVIPAYKLVFSQYVISNDQKRGLDLQEKTVDSFNEAINLGSDIAKENTIRVAQSKNKQLIKMETLKHDHQNMIETMQQVHEIDKQGKEAREAYREDMQQMEQKLLEVHRSRK